MNPNLVDILLQIGQYLYMLSPLGFLTYFAYTKHMNKKELISKDIEIESDKSQVIVKNLEIYQNMIDDLEKRYEDKLKQRDAEIEFLETKIKSLELRIRDLEN